MPKQSQLSSFARSIRSAMASLARRIAKALDEPEWVNPIYVNWMGENISWRLYEIYGAVGDQVYEQKAYQYYEQLTWTTFGEHEHCDSCLATIYLEQPDQHCTSRYFTNMNSNENIQALFCPICFVLFKAVCQGTLKIDFANAKNPSVSQ